MCLGREFRKRKLPRTSGGEGKCMIKVFLLLLLSSLLRFPPLFFLGSKKKLFVAKKKRKKEGVFLRSLSLGGNPIGKASECLQGDPFSLLLLHFSQTRGEEREKDENGSRRGRTGKVRPTREERFFFAFSPFDRHCVSFYLY